jgi:hemoglobin
MKLIPAALLLLLAGPLALAGEDAPARGGFQYGSQGAAPGNDDSLYQALGGENKIAAFTKDFVARVAKDDRIGHYFKTVNLDRLARRLTEQFIDLSGGPVKYKGGNMADVHDSLGVTNADFNRLAENLQMSMDKFDVPFATQNRLVALLAPMQRVIVTK